MYLVSIKTHQTPVDSLTQQALLCFKNYLLQSVITVIVIRMSTFLVSFKRSEKANCLIT